MPRKIYKPKGTKVRTARREKLVRLRALLSQLKAKVQKAGLANYLPNPKQRLFHLSAARNRWILGGNRGGKTEGGMADLAMALKGIHPVVSKTNPAPIKAWVVGTESKMIKAVLHAKLKKFLPDSEWEVSRPWDGSGYFRLPNGSELWFKSAEQGVEKMASEDLDYVLVDEEQDEDICRELKARLVDRRGYFACTMTPLKGLTWVYHKVLKRKPADTFIVEMSIWDNKENLSQEAILEWAATLEGEEDAEARLYGRFIAKSALFYPGFSRDKNVEEGLDAWCREHDEDLVHVLALDPGGTDLTACLYISYNKRIKRWYIRREYTARRRNVDQHAASISEMVGEDPVDEYKIGSQDTTWAAEYFSRGLDFLRCPKHQVVPVVTRIAGLFVQTAPDGKPLILVDSSCVVTIAQLESYRRKKNRWKDFEDKADPKQDDDCCDAFRNACYEEVTSNRPAPDKELEEDARFYRLMAANAAVDPVLGDQA